MCCAKYGCMQACRASVEAADAFNVQTMLLSATLFGGGDWETVFGAALYVHEFAKRIHAREHTRFVSIQTQILPAEKKSYADASLDARAGKLTRKDGGTKLDFLLLLVSNRLLDSST